MRRLAFLCNVSARWGAAAGLLRKIEGFKPAQKEIFTVDRARPDSLETHLAKILESRFDGLVLAGGDGTLNRTANFLARRKALERFSLALLPFGTCNDFAKTLGLAAGDADASLAALARGREILLRLARANDHYFVNNAGFGRRNPGGERKGALADLRAMKPSHLKVSWDAESAEGDFLMMVCANGAYFSDGLHFSRDSDPADGRLECFFVKDMPKWRLFARLLLGKAGRTLTRPGDPAVLRAEASRIVLKSDDPLWIMADGEVIPALGGIREAAFEQAESCRFITAL